jgi:hypothetical protein
MSETENVDVESQATEQPEQSEQPHIEPQAPETAQHPEWYWSDGVKGDGAPPQWFQFSKYKTVQAQAEARNSLEKRLGHLKGAPDEYNIDGFSGNPDSLLLTELKGWAKETGIDQEGFQKLLSRMSNATTTDSSERAARELEALGTDGKAIIDRITNWANSSLEPDEVETLQNMATNAKEYKLLDKLRANYKSVGRPPASAVSSMPIESLEQINQELADPKNLKRFSSNEKGYRNYVLSRKADAYERAGDYKSAQKHRALMSIKK